MKDLKELQGALADVSTQMRSLHETIGDQAWTEEQRSKWDDLKSKHDHVRSQIAREEELRSIDQKFVEDTDEREDRGEETDGELRTENLFDMFMRKGVQEMNAEQRAALKELRAQGGDTDSKGGYTVPTEMLNKVHESMKAYGGIASIAEIMNTSTGALIEWPTIDGTAIEGELLGENATATEQDETFGTENVGAKKISSKIIRISNELLLDSGIDMQSLLARRIAQRIGRTEARLLIKGTGAGSPLQPKGIEASTTAGATGKTTLKLVTEDINALVHSVDPAYRGSPKAALAFNDATLQIMEDMSDLNGRPLWLPEIAGVAPSTILNRRYVVDQGIDDIGVGKKFMFFGDWSAFIIRRVNYMVLKRLVERYAEYDQTGFLAFHRFDCVLEDTAAIKHLLGK
ncbi:phage major capsid protein [Neptuniibacter pectenicola]|uniref:phage major capsid protein n=1 Tax=Neptuniibacter pectenicola TaxID=1806669 RepID=UPI0009EF2B76|nr:phage major capsid protein [Neptuniibacter pectenicola]